MNQQPKSLLITVGVSLITNYLEKGTPGRNLQRTWKKIEDGQYGFTSISKSEGIQTKISKFIEYVVKWAEGRTDSCAEIKTLRLYGGNIKEVYLLYSDTVEGYVVAQILQILLGKELSTGKIEDTNVKKIEGANVKKFDVFETKGVQNLIKLANEIYKIEANHKLIIAYSGGYKAFIPPLTLFAQLKQLDMVYVYEDSKHPIVTGQLPSAFDWSFAEQIYPLLSNDALKQISNDSKYEKILEKLRNISLITRNVPNNSIHFLTPTGQLYAAHVNTKLPDGKSTFGHYMEYKVLEWYYNDKQIESVEKGIRYPIGKPNIVEENGKQIDKRPEIDFILRKDKQHFYNAIEVKSVYQYFKKASQFKKQLKAMEDEYKELPKKYVYILYQFDFLADFYREKIIKHKNNLIDFVRKQPSDMELEIRLINIPFDVQTENPYIDFMKEKLSNLGTIIE